jgi:hypothetical protein
VPKTKNPAILERDEAFRHTSRQYVIRCAKRAIQLAPLPEFQHALVVLELYDRNPDKKNRDYLKRIYRELRRGQKQGHRSYGYTAVGEFYRGLCHIIWASLYGTDTSNSSDTQRFTEAKYCAAVALHHKEDISRGPSLPSTVQRLESDWQWAVRTELFSKYYEKYPGGIAIER